MCGGVRSRRRRDCGNREAYSTWGKLKAAVLARLRRDKIPQATLAAEIGASRELVHAWLGEKAVMPCPSSH